MSKSKEAHFSMPSAPVIMTSNIFIKTMIFISVPGGSQKDKTINNE